MDEYKNLASNISPATIIFLINASKSMGSLVSDGKKSKLDMASDILRETIIEMMQFSLKGGTIADRYHVGIIAYSDKPYTCTDGIISIRDINNLSKLTTLKGVNTRAGFEAARDLIFNEINQWGEVKQKYCPPPMIIHLTEGVYTDGYGDPKPIAEEIKSISVSDGNVLIVNDLISEHLTVKAKDYGTWMGYLPEEDLGDPYSNELLEMSSVIPESYRSALQKRTDGQVSLLKGTKLLFPGSSEQFVKLAFMMSLCAEHLT